MSDRITEKDLQHAIDLLNKMTGNPMKSYENGHACIGNFHMAGAYGGYNVHQICSKGGAITTPLGAGYYPKKVIYDRLMRFMDGIEYARRNEQTVK